MNEIERLLGRKTYKAMEQFEESKANNPENKPHVQSRLNQLIAEGRIASNGETATTMRAAMDGEWFKTSPDKVRGVCMDGWGDKG